MVAAENRPNITTGGTCGFQTCEGKRKSSFAVADLKSELEDFLFSRKSGKADFKLASGNEGLLLPWQI
jgi:hypothetical protein